MLTELFLSHVEVKTCNYLNALEQSGWEHVIISSGSELIQFRDDLTYPFKVNPYFKEFLPLTQRPNCFLLISEDLPRPKLMLKDVKNDFWHTEPQQLHPEWEAAFDVCTFTETKELFALLPKDTRRLAYLGPKMSSMSGVPDDVRNPMSLIDRIDWQRGVKTPYEQACVREANRIAVRGHRAAEQAFRARKSELGILLDYLQATNCAQDDLAYPAIMGINEHAAVLHHNRLNRRPPEVSRSLLIDAGNTYNGYASDITRTYAADEDSPFAGMIRALDAAQQQMVAELTPGKSYADVHVNAHRHVAEILVEFGILNGSVDAAIEQGTTVTFFPHGLGHFLGIQVHDKGGHLASPEGGDNFPPADHPHLRATRTIEVGQIFTVEPGIYFIPQLLAALRSGERSNSVNWQRVEEFIPFGGIRIEDNVLVTEAGVENFTRDAFIAS